MEWSAGIEREGGSGVECDTVRPNTTTEVTVRSVSVNEDGERSYSIIIICYGSQY